MEGANQTINRIQSKIDIDYVDGLQLVGGASLVLGMDFLSIIANLEKLMDRKNRYFRLLAVIAGGVIVLL